MYYPPPLRGRPVLAGKKVLWQPNDLVMLDVRRYSPGETLEFYEQHKRKRGNRHWGLPIPPVPALPTEFELRVRQLQLTAEMYTSSRALRGWCERNRNRCYVPEWLLEEWGITVDAAFSEVA